MTPAERATLVGRYKVGYATLIAALDGIAGSELDWRPSPEAWSVRAVVHHLKDAELTGAVQTRILRRAESTAIEALPDLAIRVDDVLG